MAIGHRAASLQSNMAGFLGMKCTVLGMRCTVYLYGYKVFSPSYFKIHENVCLYKTLITFVAALFSKPKHGNNLRGTKKRQMDNWAKLVRWNYSVMSNNECLIHGTCWLCLGCWAKCRKLFVKGAHHVIPHLLRFSSGKIMPVESKLVAAGA